jgi:hypothetical protein
MLLRKLAEITALITALTGLVSAIVLSVKEIINIDFSGNTMTFDMPKQNGDLVDICLAKDTECEKDGKRTNATTASVWCKDNGYQKATRHTVSRDRTPQPAFRLNGVTEDRCKVNCYYFTSITCIRS